MPGEAAKRWLCPFFFSNQYAKGTVWVQNPNPNGTEVAVHFYAQWGEQQETVEKWVYSGGTNWFQTEHPGHMVVVVESEVPVFPAGHAFPAAYGSSDDDKRVALTFYKYEKPEYIIPDNVIVSRKSLPDDHPGKKLKAKSPERQTSA